ncbi:hypothetical protein [Synechococcus sp. RedBA-s]|uniref:hypothetical protein n=1 Tax=Synechococcus sp. RedBA-s TaxID=2823741 RepID=UPI0020CC81A3|nr:hypothetical protein [Synechococcus sp. RedBA-s]MCP9800224.1 hypothetical protein [Synechococcus sp. RedBA-s]
MARLHGNDHQAPALVLSLQSVALAHSSGAEVQSADGLSVEDLSTDDQFAIDHLTNEQFTDP